MIESNARIKECCRRRSFRFVSVIFLLVFSLVSCITTTTGGFAGDASDEEALQDYIQLAIAYYDAGNMNRARFHIDNVLEIDSENSEIYGVLALVSQREGDTDLADEAFLRSIGFDQQNSRARNNYAAFLFSQNRFREAYEQLQLVSADTGYEGRALAFESLGRSALRIGDEESAEQAFERALQLNTNLYLSVLELAQINFNKEQLDTARSTYNRFLTIREFGNIPHTPRSLWIGIQIEREFQNSDTLDGYVRLLTTLYRDAPEYQLYRNLIDGN